MKKIVASTALAALITPPLSLNADSTVVSVHEEPAVVVEQQAPESYSNPSFDGLNFILGIGGSFLKCKLQNDNVTYSKNANRFIGTLGLGYGKTFRNKWYVGIEALLDFTKNKKWELFSKNRVSSHMKSGGLFPSLGLRLGYVIQKYNTMVYFKIAGSHSSCKAWTEGVSAADGGDQEYKANKIVPTLTLGLEKAFGKRFTARLEGEYRFKSTKTIDDDGELKGNEGFNVRALVSYNVRF